MFSPRPPLSIPGWSPTGATGSTLPYTTLNPATALQLANRPSSGPSTNTGTGTYQASVSNPSADQDAEEARRWDQYVAYQTQLLDATSGWEREQARMQLDNAQKARDNAWKIAQLSSETSRYGVDVGRETALDQLRQDQKQFDANHALERQKLGLTYADTATRYMETPDRFFTAGRYLNMASRFLNNEQNAAPYGSTGTATPKTEQDFAVLAGGGIPGQNSQGSASDIAMQAASAGGGPQADARTKALMAVIKAVPPSGQNGLDNNDFAVLQAAKALYSTNLTPRQYRQIETDPEYAGITNSALRTGGYNADAWNLQQRRNRLGQGAVGRA